MSLRRVLVLTLATTLTASLAGPALVAGGPGTPVVRRGSTLAEGGTRALEGLPWSPDVIVASLGRTGPVALTQVYVQSQDVLAVDNRGKVFCLSRRDLEPRWVTSLKAPLAAPPAESPSWYVFLLRDASGAAWLQWVSRRSGADADHSPVRLDFAPSSGVSATDGLAFVGSLGSARGNKTLESINLADGSPGWGYRTAGRIVGTPIVDPAGDMVLVAVEDKGLMSFPASQSPLSASIMNWRTETLAANKLPPAVTKDWGFLASDDNLVRGFDIHSGTVMWLQGIDAPALKAPWLLGSLVTRDIAAGGEGGTAARVQRFEGYVFVRNQLGLHAFDAASGEPVFKDANADRPLAMVGDWVVTVDAAKTAQLRRGKGLPVEKVASLNMFDFLPTNTRDGTIIAGQSDGTIFLAVPK
jgi:outer membrane protein assembly factor BamB